MNPRMPFGMSESQYWGRKWQGPGGTLFGFDQPGTEWLKRLNQWQAPSAEEMKGWDTTDPKEQARLLLNKMLHETEGFRYAPRAYTQGLQDNPMLPLLYNMVRAGAKGQEPTVSGDVLRNWVTQGQGRGWQTDYRNQVQALLNRIQEGRAAAAGTPQADRAGFWWQNPDLLGSALGLNLTSKAGQGVRERIGTMTDWMRTQKNPDLDWVGFLLQQVPWLNYRW